MARARLVTMEAPDIPESRDRLLNRAVAVTVLLLSVTMAIGRIKDDDIVQGMQRSMSAQVDRWSEYQSARLKLHAQQIAATAFGLSPAAGASAAATAAGRAAARYDRESSDLRLAASQAAEAYGSDSERHGQFDFGDGFGSIGLAVSAVAAVVESRRLLALGWIFGAVTLLFMIAGFTGLAIHPGLLIASLA